MITMDVLRDLFYLRVVCRAMHKSMPGDSGIELWDEPGLRPEIPPSALFQKGKGFSCVC